MAHIIGHTSKSEQTRLNAVVRRMFWCRSDLQLLRDGLQHRLIPNNTTAVAQRFEEILPMALVLVTISIFLLAIQVVFRPRAESDTQSR